jgi:hypothetical protein
MRALSVFAFALALIVPQLATADYPPCSCLQELWVDYPGPYDLYIALSKEFDCNETGEEDLWFGQPGNYDLPQICENNECEEYQGNDRRGAQALPGHGQILVGAKAWDVFRVGLESAARRKPGLEYGTPTYHKIPRRNLPANIVASGDMIVVAIPMVVHAKGSRIDGETYYLCVQIDSAEGVTLTPATFENGKPGRGSQMQIKYRVNGNMCNGLVWLK